MFEQSMPPRRRIGLETPSRRAHRSGAQRAVNSLEVLRGADPNVKSKMPVFGRGGLRSAGARR